MAQGQPARRCPRAPAKGVFDGIDLDWEWPASEGNAGNVIRPEDKQNFTALVRRVPQAARRARRDRGRYNLTAFLPADPAKIDAGFEVEQALQLPDFGTVAGLRLPRLRGSRPTNQQSAIDGPKGDPTTPEFSSQVTIDAYLSRGAPRSKLVMGVPFYGHGWTGVTNQNNGLFQPATGPAPATYEAGNEDYRCLKATLAELHGPPRQQGRVRLAVRRYDVLDLRRPGRDEAQGAVHLAAAASAAR